jgi:hypothetical protein
MVVDTLFDSLCRCFCASDGQNAQTAGDENSYQSSPGRRGVRHAPNGKKVVQVRGDSDGALRKKMSGSRPTLRDTDQAYELATAKLASTSFRKKRKSPATKRDEIFRSRDFERRDKPEPETNSFSRFLGSHQGNLANALCFATPINDEEEPNEIVKNDSDCNTLNTAEDTVTSTLFFERKYAHIVEHRPPMPLFSDFKVEDDYNELRRIVASDSHNSLKMIRLLGESPGQCAPKVLLEESEDEDVVVEDDDVPPAIKIDSSASSSEASRR